MSVRVWRRVLMQVKFGLVGTCAVLALLVALVSASADVAREDARSGRMAFIEGDKTRYHATACAMAKPPRAALKREILNAAARALPRGEIGREHEGTLGDFAKPILASEASICRKFVVRNRPFQDYPGPARG
jgi:hypothetical protein